MPEADSSDQPNWWFYLCDLEDPSHWWADLYDYGTFYINCSTHSPSAAPDPYNLVETE